MTTSGKLATSITALVIVSVFIEAVMGWSASNESKAAIIIFVCAFWIIEAIEAKS